MINKTVQPIKAQLELQNNLFMNALRNISDVKMPSSDWMNMLAR